MKEEGIYKSTDSSKNKIEISIVYNTMDVTHLRRNGKVEVGPNENQHIEECRKLNVIHEGIEVKMDRAGKFKENGNIYKRLNVPGIYDLILILKPENDYEKAEMYEYKDLLNIDENEPIAYLVKVN